MLFATTGDWSGTWDIFVTSLAIRGGSLVITNERGERYLLDLLTRKVIRESDPHT